MAGKNPYQSPRHLASYPEDRTTKWLRLFCRGFLWWGAFPTILTVFLVATGQNPGVPLLLTAAWWLVGLTLHFQSKAGFLAAFVMVSGLWLLAFYQTVRRIIFIIENQGLERADGMGSPLAFFLGLAFEQVFLFVPMSILLGLGTAAIFSRSKVR